MPATCSEGPSPGAGSGCGRSLSPAAGPWPSVLGRSWTESAAVLFVFQVRLHFCRVAARLLLLAPGTQKVPYGREGHKGSLCAPPAIPSSPAEPTLPEVGVPPASAPQTWPAQDPWEVTQIPTRLTQTEAHDHPRAEPKQPTTHIPLQKTGTPLTASKMPPSAVGDLLYFFGQITQDCD